MAQASIAKKLLHYWLLWVPPAVIGLSALFYRQVLAAERFAAEHISACAFHNLTGLLCPGCGCTRSVTAMLHGKFLLALHENPAAPFLVLLLLLFYAERIAALFGKNLRLIPRKRAFWITILALQLIWAVLRNFIPVLMPIT